MYEYIKGILTKITAKYIVVETAGIGYLLHVANPYAYSGKMNQEVQVYLHQVVREDAHLLYGFATEEEKKLFLNLISVSGIGPVSALAIIAADDNAGLVQAIESKNITYLTKFPKIGKKTAQQMVLDLEGKINLDLEDAPAQSNAKVSEENQALEEAMENGDILSGVINGKVKGGLTVMINSIRAFLPGSLVDVRPVKDTSHFEGKEIEFKVIKLDKKRNNVVVSRRAVLEATLGEERKALLENLQEGSVIKGIVKNITDYGAFVDLGGIDGLLHITDLAWRRVKHPSEVLEVGQEVEAKVLKFDQDKQRVSLGMKQLGEDPWSGLTRRYPQGTRLFGKVSNLTDYGAFVEIEQGIEGLVHVSEMDWTNKNVHPSKVVQLGDEVEVMILEIDEDRRRISLGMKQCQANPWEEFAANHNKGDKISGAVKSITDFGVFVGLPGGIDGLVHLSDLSWTEAGEEAVRKYKKGEEVEAVVLAIDVEKERISLGIKQLEGDPFGNFISVNDKGSLVKGSVKSVDAKGAVVALSEEVEGYLPASEFAADRVEDLTTKLKEGDEVEAVIVTVDRKNRSIRLSVKAKDAKENREALNSVNAAATANAGTTSLGDLLKAKLSGDQE